MSREPNRKASGTPRGVVGVGASAGGLGSLVRFFSHARADEGLAYVVVQHLAPQRATLLSRRLSRCTRMAVVEAKDGAPAESNCVHVIVPGTLLEMRGGCFRVKAGDKRQGPLDTFFRSLAEDQRERALGIVLSGPGVDGASGLRAIKEHGGLTFAEAPEAATPDSVPRRAIEAGVVDHVLPVEKIAQQLVVSWKAAADRRMTVASSGAGPALSDEQLAASLQRICEIVKRATGHDFSRYRPATLIRRLRGHERLRRAQTLDAYVEFLAKDQNETEGLAKDLLIGVTQFFRDRDAFAYLGSHVIPQIFANKSRDDRARIWVPGCGSGEEAYSIAMLVQEHLAGADTSSSVQIFGTDIDPDAIAEARRGRYPLEVVEHVSAERVARFFKRVGSSYQVTPSIRAMCAFSEHNLIRDAPFLSLDLISCRNVLVYLDTALRENAVSLFHYALNRGGYLFLGSLEIMAAHPDRFETVDKRFRIFRRIEAPTRPRFDFPLQDRAVLRAASANSAPDTHEPESVDGHWRSSHEELRRANQELDSSQEELQSLNAELVTVNSELDRKVEALARANSDLQNLFSSTEMAIVFLDREQRVVKHTPAAKAFFKFIEADAGRRLSDLAPRFVGLDLASEAKEIVRTLHPVERQVETIDGQAWYLVRILPYRTVEGDMAGSVVTLADITQVKRGEAERERLVGELSETQKQLTSELEATNRLLRIGSLYLHEGNVAPVLGEIVDAAIAICDADFGNIQLLDRASGDLKIAAHRGFPGWWLEFWDHVQEGHGSCGTALERGERTIVEDIETSAIFVGSPAFEIQRRAGVRAVQSTPLFGRTGSPIGMLSTHFRRPTRPSERALRLLDLLARQAADILDRVQAQEVVRLTGDRLASAVESIEDAFALFDANDRLILCNGAYRRFIGDKLPGDIVGRSFEELLDLWIGDVTFPDEETRRRFRLERLARRREPTATFEVGMRDGRRLRILDRRTPEGGSVKTIWDLTDDPRRLHDQNEARRAPSEERGSGSSSPTGARG